jgi:hypothetical protein
MYKRAVGCFRGSVEHRQKLRHGYIVYEATVSGQKRVGILRRVLFAPNTGINLVSVGQIASLGIKLNFSGAKFGFVRNKKSGSDWSSNGNYSAKTWNQRYR